MWLALSTCDNGVNDRIDSVCSDAIAMCYFLTTWDHHCGHAMIVLSILLT